MGKPNYYTDFARQNVVWLKPAAAFSGSVADGRAVYVFVESGRLVFNYFDSANPDKCQFFGVVFSDQGGNPSFLWESGQDSYPIVTEGACWIPLGEIGGPATNAGDLLYLTGGVFDGEFSTTRPTLSANRVLPVAVVLQSESLEQRVGLNLVYIFPNDYYRQSAGLVRLSTTVTDANYTAIAGQFITTDTSSNSVTIDLPLGSSLPEPSMVSVKVKDNSNPTIIDPNAADTIDGSGGTITLLKQESVITLFWNGIEWQVLDLYEPINQTNLVYVGKHGNNSNDGLSVGNAKLTITDAISDINGFSPSTSSRWVIRILDAGIYTESVTFTDEYVSIDASKARIVGDVTLLDDTSINIDSIDGSIIKSAGTGIAAVKAREVDSGTSDGVTSDSGTITLNIQDILVSTGSGLTGDANLRGHVNRILVSGSGGNAIDAEASCVYNLSVNEIDASASGGDGILVAAGAEANLTIQRLEADDDAYNVTATGLLNLIVSTLVGDEVGDAVDVNVNRPRRVSDVQTSAYTAKPEETVFVDPSGGSFTVDLPSAPVAGTFVRVTNVTTSANVITLDGDTNDVEDPDLALSSMGTTAGITQAGFSYGYVFTGTFWKIVEGWQSP